MNASRPASLVAIVLSLWCLFGALSRAHAQPPPGPPKNTTHDTNGDGAVDLTVRLIDTNANGVADQVHIDSDSDGVIDPGERVINNVVGFSIIGGAGGFTITVLENAGTEQIKTTLKPFDANGDGDCGDPGEMRQDDSMPDSTAAIRLRFANGNILDTQLNGQSEFRADLNRIVPVGGNDAIPIELVLLTLTSTQQLTVRLLQNLPARGRLVEDDNPVPGNLDGQRFAGAGTFDAVFELFVEVDVSGSRLFNRDPIVISSFNGIYSPDIGQTFLHVGPVPLFDVSTGQPAGVVLEQFALTPHSAPRLDCNCDKIAIKPLIRTHKDSKDKEILDSPKPSGAISADDHKVYEVEIVVEWDVTITCSGPGTRCVGTYHPSAASDGWKVDGKKSAPVGLDSHTGTGALGDVVCEGECTGEPLTVHPPPATTYKVRVKKGAGGDITNSVSGEIKLAMNPVDCVGNSWTMILVFEADLKKGEVSINQQLSDWDGDGKINAADKNPLDPSKK